MKQKDKKMRGKKILFFILAVSLILNVWLLYEKKDDSIQSNIPKNRISNMDCDCEYEECCHCDCTCDQDCVTDKKEQEDMQHQMDCVKSGNDCYYGCDEDRSGDCFSNCMKKYGCEDY